MREKKTDSKANRNEESVTMYRLYRFERVVFVDDGQDEFVVISDLESEEVIAEHCLPGEFELVESVSIETDAGSFPCDRPLR